MIKALLDIIKAPYKLLTAFLSFLLLVMGCMLLYSYRPVQEGVDKIAEKTPKPVVEVVSKGMELVGLKEQEEGLGAKIWERVMKIPTKCYDIAAGLGKITLDRLLDALFHPITIIVCGAFVYWWWKKN